MKANKVKYLAPLFLFPLLLANSPAPFPEHGHYKDIEVAYSFVSESGDYRKYDLTITNTGESFALIHRGLFTDNDWHFYDVTDNNIFETECVGSGKTKVFQLTTKAVLENEIEATTKWETVYYPIVDNGVSYTNPNVTVDNGDCVIKANFKNVGDYYYAAVVELKYQSETYFVDSKYNGSLRFSIGQDLNPSDVEIQNITFFRSSYHVYMSRLLPFFITYLVIIGVFLVTTITSITVFLIVRNKRNKNKEIK
ncbi:MAG: hypothetical protein J5955_00665 [Bacilli bacterium]|nr:hypothetical protein [Bacilli bacterium]